MDDKPQETGWSLACNGKEIENAPPGSYSMITGAFDHFRMAYLATVPLGGECELTVLDTGNDGVDGGFFEVYFGDDIENEATRIDSGLIDPSETRSILTVPEAEAAPPPPPSPVAPTPAPAPTPTDGTTPTCTVCPDGNPVPNPFATAEEWDLSCSDLETFASNRNATECRRIQISAGNDCGCKDFCTTICPDGISDPPTEEEDELVFVQGGSRVTCSDFQRQVASSGSNSLEECLSANYLGEDVCGCDPTDRFCRICQGGIVPPRDALEREIVPGVSCRDITAIAYTLRAADPSGIFFRLCPACLAIGVYCGCVQPPPPSGREFCRLCGDTNEDLLPVPSRIVNSSTVGFPTTCFHLELVANIASDDTLECSAYREDGTATCCASPFNPITVLIQLDEKPQETGWSLSCGGEEIVKVPPGSYSMITGAFDHFRVEYATNALKGSECELTILDTGNDGSDGFFEVYVGDDIENEATRIDSGLIDPSETRSIFTVPEAEAAPPPPPSPVAPTPAPAPTPTDGTTPTCTVCPDGNPVPNPFATAEEWDLSCSDLETFASNRNATECRRIQISAGNDCGCKDFCTTICPDDISDPPMEKEGELVFVRGTSQVTCGDLHREISSSGSDSIEECLSANYLGEDVCGCEPTDRFCRICQGGIVPPRDALEREIVPGVSCRDITAIAYTLRAADPSGIFFRLCPACLAIGVYCGCEQPPPPSGREFCRLCGDTNEDLLPEPSRIVDSSTVGFPTTCFHLELVANIASDDTLECSAYREDGTATCCA
jgi:hypothetical protein